MLMAKTIRSKHNLGSIDIAINRPEPNQPPIGLYSAHIEGDEGIISEGVIGLWTQFNELFRIKNCDDICIEYDGSWVKNSMSNSYDFYTIGDPYILYTRKNQLGMSTLYVQQSNGIPIQLASGKIDSISLCRGWKSLIDDTEDQGLIAAYVVDGKVYYRSLISNGNVLIWDKYNILDIPYTNIKTIRVSRTNDYRVLFNGVLDTGDHFMAYSTRCWAGFAVDSEIVSRTSYVGEYKVTPINTIETNEITENIKRTSYSGKATIVSTLPPTHFKCINLDERTIDIIHGTDLVTSDPTAILSNIVVTDSRNRKYSVLEVSQLRNRTRLKTVKFNNVTGPLNVSYIGEIGLTTSLNTPVDAFKCTFYPTGLIPDEIDPPKLTKIININNNEGVIDYEL